MPIVRWRYRPDWRDPWELLHRDFDRFFYPFSGDESSSRVRASEFPVDVFEDKDHVFVEAELPGFRKDEVSAEIEEGVLHIKAEHKTAEQGTEGARKRKPDRLERTLNLPATVEPNQVDARMEDGILKLVFNKTERAKQQLIQIR